MIISRCPVSGSSVVHGNRRSPWMTLHSVKPTSVCHLVVSFTLNEEQAEHHFAQGSEHVRPHIAHFFYTMQLYKYRFKAKERKHRLIESGHWCADWARRWFFFFQDQFGFFLLQLKVEELDSLLQCQIKVKYWPFNDNVLQCFVSADTTDKLYNMIGHLWWAASQQSPLVVNYL